MKVAILTMFTGLSTTYSLVNVVADQIAMLLHHGISVKVLVSEMCPDGQRSGIFADPRIQWVKITNTLQGRPITWYDYTQAAGAVHETFNQEAEVIAADYVAHLQDVEVCILHDILYQGWHLIHNVAVRCAQLKLPGVRFLSFTHSMPAPHPSYVEPPFSGRFTPMPNTTFVYPTQSGIPALAAQYGVPEKACAVVHNAFPMLELASPEVQQVIRHANLLQAQILVVYPARLTLAKGFEKVAALAGAVCTESGKSTKVVFCDFPSADIPSHLYKKMIRTQGIRYGLSQQDMVFTSDLGYVDGFPRSGVLELFQISNLFICPSYSESFGLTVLEAASRGNFLVLNEAVPALEELGTALGAYFMRWDARNFGYDTRETYHPSLSAYYHNHGAAVTQQMDQDSVLAAKTKVRTQYHPDWIFQHQLRPLLVGE